MVPYCNAQLGAFQRTGQGLADAGIRVAALSVDDEATMAELAGQRGLAFPVGYGADAPAVAAVTGFVLDRRHDPPDARSRARRVPGPVCGTQIIPFAAGVSLQSGREDDAVPVAAIGVGLAWTDAPYETRVSDI